MNYNPSLNLIAHIKSFEGCKLKAYKCPSGVWTIGYGHTSGVMPNSRCTQAQADAWLRLDIARHAQLLSRHIRVDLSQSQMDAIVDMAFNVGVSAVVSSTLLRYINEQRPHHEIQNQFMRWTKSNGRVLNGLKKRCEWRAAQWKR